MEYGARLTQTVSLQPIGDILWVPSTQNAIALPYPESQHIVLLNPPYQNTRKINNSPLKQWFPNASSDLFAAFMQRAIEWLRPDGSAGLLTMHNWMFLRQHQKLRVWLLQRCAPALH